jgi:hypothetical protein
MSGQELLVILALAVALAYLAWRGWRALRGRSAGCCGKGCGSTSAGANKASAVPLQQLTLRQRSGR